MLAAGALAVFAFSFYMAIVRPVRQRKPRPLYEIKDGKVYRA